MQSTEIPDQLRVRLLLTFDRVTFKKFYWFEMKNQDFYWGSSYKSVRSDKTRTKIDGSQATVFIPENFDELPKLNGKYSYHESGAVHYKAHLAGGLSTFDKHSKWKLKNQIEKPTRFYTIISKSLKHYDQIINNPNKGKSYAFALNFDPSCTEKRVYFEFFISPVGSFEIPNTLIKGDRLITEIATHSLSKNLILVIRFAVIGSMDNWHPDKEIVFLPNDMS